MTGKVLSRRFERVESPTFSQPQLIIRVILIRVKCYEGIIFCFHYKKKKVMKGGENNKKAKK